MKNILFIFLCISIIACKKGNRSGNNQFNVTVKGSIPAGLKTKSGVDSALLQNARNVLILFGDMSMVVPVKNGTFSANIPSGTGTAFIFVDDKNHYIGHLSVNDLNMLPLMNMSGDTTTIDLKTLSQSGVKIIPAYNPIGKELQLNQSDIDFYKSIDSYYESLGQNIDTDNDGVPDNFVGKQIVLGSMYNVVVGAFGVDEKKAKIFDPSQQQLYYGMRVKVWDAFLPKNTQAHPVLTGPEENPTNDIEANYGYYPNCGCLDIKFSRAGNSGHNPPFEKGTYTFTLDGTDLHKIHFESFDLKYFLIIAKPTLVTDSAGYVTNVTLEYSLPDSSVVNPYKFITSMALQFGLVQNKQYQEGSFFDFMHVLPDFTNIQLTTKQKLSDIQGINVAYTDLIGNIYNISWQKP